MLRSPLSKLTAVDALAQCIADLQVCLGCVRKLHLVGNLSTVSRRKPGLQLQLKQAIVLRRIKWERMFEV